MKTIVSILLLSVCALTGIVSAQEIQATLVFRTAGDPATGQYKNGFTAKDKGNFGGHGENIWKAFVVFDALAYVDEFAQGSKGKLKVQIDWLKDPSAVTDATIIYAGAHPDIILKDSHLHAKFSIVGKAVATIPSAELATLKQHRVFEFPLEGIIPPGEVTPANRYVYFRIQAPMPASTGANGMMGISNLGEKHIMQIGEGGASSSEGGGYL